MEPIWSEEIDAILSQGRFLGDDGIRNWALSRREALVALDAFRNIGVATLGGDVFRLLPSGRFDSAYDNWYCDRKPGEDRSEYIERCATVAKGYVGAYVTADEVRCFFALVPKHV